MPVSKDCPQEILELRKLRDCEKLQDQGQNLPKLLEPSELALSLHPYLLGYKVSMPSNLEPQRLQFLSISVALGVYHFSQILDSLESLALTLDTFRKHVELSCQDKSTLR